MMLPGLRELSTALASGELTASRLVEDALGKVRDNKSVFVRINPGLVNLAYAIDRGRRRRQQQPPLAGIPIALKDLFNLRNENTLAGSVVRRHVAEPEASDAAVAAPLRAAGLLFLGRTNMSEFAFSGIGTNSHYGTPLSVWDRATGRLPGGSSSGSGVAIGAGIVAAALGSDTAGSCRIPAAFNGVVGVKPSHGRLSLSGVYPLSPTLDAPGPLAVDVDSCFILDQLMRGTLGVHDELPPLQAQDIAGIRLAVPQDCVMQDLDTEVARDFERTIACLRAAGIRVETVALPILSRCDRFFREKSLVLYEVYQHHRELLQAHGDEYDPFVAQRMRTGADVSEDMQQARYRERNEIVAEFLRDFAALDCDALLYPTVACIPPPIADMADDEHARALNLRCLRNTATVNIFDGCAISLPCHTGGDAPVGLMLASRHGDDEHLYRVAASVETVLRTSRA
ncbi:MAG: amidase family protein [Gammaproteobacteria bacterium]|nr:amidase family protein [Gammaproteobacteria bacterium]